MKGGRRLRRGGIGRGGGGVRDSRLAALVLVQVHQVRLDIGTRHLQSSAPLTTEHSFEEIAVGQGQHALQGGPPPPQPGDRTEGSSHHL